MEQVTIAEAQARLADLVAAAQRGEEVYIVDADQQRLRLMPLPTPQHESEQYLTFGSAHGLIRYMAADFDTPLEDFREYME